MATKKKKKDPQNLFGLLVQLAAIAAIVVVILIDTKSADQISDWLYGALFGLAYGARPETLDKLLPKK